MIHPHKSSNLTPSEPEAIMEPTWITARTAELNALTEEELFKVYKVVHSKGKTTARQETMVLKILSVEGAQRAAATEANDGGEEHAPNTTGEETETLNTLAQKIENLQAKHEKMHAQYADQLHQLAMVGAPAAHHGMTPPRHGYQEMPEMYSPASFVGGPDALVDDIGTLESFVGEHPELFDTAMHKWLRSLEVKMGSTSCSEVTRRTLEGKVKQLAAFHARVTGGRDIDIRPRFGTMWDTQMFGGGSNVTPNGTVPNPFVTPGTSKTQEAITTIREIARKSYAVNLSSDAATKLSAMNYEKDDVLKRSLQIIQKEMPKVCPTTSAQLRVLGEWLSSTVTHPEPYKNMIKEICETIDRLKQMGLEEPELVVEAQEMLSAGTAVTAEAVKRGASPEWASINRALQTKTNAEAMITRIIGKMQISINAMGSKSQGASGSWGSKRGGVTGYQTDSGTKTASSFKSSNSLYEEHPGLQSTFDKAPSLKAWAQSAKSYQGMCVCIRHLDHRPCTIMQTSWHKHVRGAAALALIRAKINMGDAEFAAAFPEEPSSVGSASSGTVGTVAPEDPGWETVRRR